MKKVILFIIFILLLTIIILVYRNNNNTNILKIGRLENVGVTEIQFFNQPTHNVIKIDDKDKIKEFMNYLELCTVKKEKEHQNADGYIYTAQLFSNDKLVSNITFTNPMKVNDSYYSIVKGGITKEMIDTYLKNAK